MRVTSLQVLLVFFLSLHGYQQFARAQDDDDDEEEIIPTSTATEEEAYVPPEGSESFAFEAEVNRMLDIVVNSLYKNKDVFLRELISNSADAIDKFRYMSLTDSENYKVDDEISDEIKIHFDEENLTLTISDTGIGMTKEELVKNLGTVARSGTTKFLEALKESGDNDASLQQIGQFGVGFYSSFLVSSRVTVASKHPLSDTQWVWESTNGASEFVIFADPRGDTLGRGTEITLQLRSDAKEYADSDRLREMVTHYSEFITTPIMLRVTEEVEVEVEPEEDDDAEVEEKKDDEDLEISDDEDAEDDEKPKETKMVKTQTWEQVNTNTPIWTRSKDEITDEEYQSFFTALSKGEFTDATHWTHFNAEGNVNFKSILYLPGDVPAQYQSGVMEAQKGALRLYVRRVLIGDDFDLLPRYFSFVRGVVDSDELPLNVNRETLQENKILKVIKKKLTRKAIDTIREFAKPVEEEEEDEAEAEIDADGEVEVEKKKKKVENVKYIKWYEKFGTNLKLGAIEDEPNRNKLMKLLRFKTSKSGSKYVSLQEYVDNMKDWQEDIYVLGAPSLEEAKKNSFLAGFKEKDLEVIFMTDTIDEYLVSNVRDYSNKKFVHITSENVKFKDEDDDLRKRRETAYRKKFKPLTNWLKKLFKTTILRVQMSGRSLGPIPAAVTSATYGNSANMDRILRAQAFQSGSTPGMGSMKIMELNPRHPIVLKLLEGAPPEEEDEENPFEILDETLDSAWMLHDMAMLNGGFPIDDVASHNKRIEKVLQKTFGLDSLDLEDPIEVPDEDEDEEAPEPDFDLDGLNMADFGGSIQGDIDGLNIQGPFEGMPDI